MCVLCDCSMCAGGSTLAPGERAALLLPIFTVLTSSVTALRAMQDAAADTANNHLDEDGSASLRQLSQVCRTVYRAFFFLF